MDPIEHEVSTRDSALPLGHDKEREGEGASIIPPRETEPLETRILLGILLGAQGLRAGWSIAVFAAVFFLVTGIVGSIFLDLNLIDPKAHFTATASLFGELVPFLSMLAAGVVVALLERKRGNVLVYNLSGPKRASYFVQGLIAGFVSLSALIGVLAWGGWLHFGPVALSGVQIFRYALLWGLAFLLVGFVEEGLFRCFLVSELTRSTNFWWALAISGAVCIVLAFTAKGSEVWGVYLIASLGAIPCLLLQLRKAEGASFWQAAWASSTLFGFIHTGNHGENWIGIFAAAAIGFVFVVSVRVTGSAWWAIGCHAAWDWAETYFYGAADSGNVASGHYLSTSASGSALWSGGADGPEGSILILVILLLMVVALVMIYGRRKIAPSSASSAELAAG